MSALLTTERLVLRDFRDDDFEAVHAYASDPEVVEYVPWGPNTETDTRDFLERATADASADPRTRYALAVVRSEDDRLLGCAVLYLENAAGHQAMLGYALARAAWGEGYALEAARALMSFGFDVLGIHRIWAACDPDNRASVRILERLGMRLEGRMREDTRVRGVWRDSRIYALLEHEHAP